MVARPTQKSDIYSLAMVSIEIFTGRVPFPELQVTAVILQIMRGRRPKRPEDARELGLSDSVWEMVERCWEKVPDQRPNMSEITSFFREAASDFVYAPKVPATFAAGYTQAAALTKDVSMPPIIAPSINQSAPPTCEPSPLPAVVSTPQLESVVSSSVQPGVTFIKSVPPASEQFTRIESIYELTPISQPGLDPAHEEDPSTLASPNPTLPQRSRTNSCVPLVSTSTQNSTLTTIRDHPSRNSTQDKTASVLPTPPSTLAPSHTPVHLSPSFPRKGKWYSRCCLIQ